MYLPVNHEDVTKAASPEIIRQLTAPEFGELITRLEKAVEIVGFCDFFCVLIVPLQGEIEIDELKKLMHLRADLAVIKCLLVGLHSQLTLESTVAESSAYVDDYTGVKDASDRKSEQKKVGLVAEDVTGFQLLKGGQTQPNTL